MEDGLFQPSSLVKPHEEVSFLASSEELASFLVVSNGIAQNNQLHFHFTMAASPWEAQISREDHVGPQNK